MNSASFSCSNFFVCGSADRLGSLWEFGRKQPLRLFSGHTSDVEVRVCTNWFLLWWWSTKSSLIVMSLILQIIKCWPSSILVATGSTDSTVKMYGFGTSLRYYGFGTSLMHSFLLVGMFGPRIKCAIFVDINLLCHRLLFHQTDVLSHLEEQQDRS